MLLLIFNHLGQKGVALKQCFVASENRRAYSSFLYYLLSSPSCPRAHRSDTDPDRGTTTVKQDIFGDHFGTVEYLHRTGSLRTAYGSIP